MSRRDAAALETLSTPIFDRLRATPDRPEQATTDQAGSRATRTRHYRTAIIELGRDPDRTAATGLAWGFQRDSDADARATARSGWAPRAGSLSWRATQTSQTNGERRKRLLIEQRMALPAKLNL
jgi:hypothetical protein